MYQPQKILDPGLRSLLGVVDTLSGSTLFVSYSKYSKRVKIGIYFYQSRYLRDTGVQYKVLLEAGWILWSWLIFSWNSVRKPRWFAIKGDEVLPQKEWLKELFHHWNFALRNIWRRQRERLQLSLTTISLTKPADMLRNLSFSTVSR